MTPLQTISLVSTIANDGVYTPPRIVAGELPPDSKALPVVFHPAQQHRVISTDDGGADEEDDGRRGAVRHRAPRDPRWLHGRRQNRHGAESRSETGTYSKTKYVASFIGFSPVNTPAITIAVILDSPVGSASGRPGLRAGVQAHRRSRSLEYLHVPHDLDVKKIQRQTLIASRQEATTERRSRPTIWALRC